MDSPTSFLGIRGTLRLPNSYGAYARDVACSKLSDICAITLNVDGVVMYDF